MEIFLFFAFTSFFIGWFILMVVNPATSSMLRFYEKTKSQYAKDIDHLVSFNKNGLWIKENLENGKRIVTAKKPMGHDLVDVKIFHFDNKFLLKEKIFGKKANIKNFEWVLTMLQFLKMRLFIFKRLRNI